MTDHTITLTVTAKSKAAVLDVAREALRAIARGSLREKMTQPDYSCEYNYDGGEPIAAGPVTESYQ